MAQIEPQTTHYSPLAELQGQFRASLAPEFSAYCAANGRAAQTTLTLDQERACDAMIGEGVKWLAANRPKPANKRAMRRKLERHMAEIGEKRTLTDSGEMICGFGIIITALLSFLIGKAIGFLWDWFFNTENSVELVCGMVA